MSFICTLLTKCDNFSWCETMKLWDATMTRESLQVSLQHPPMSHAWGTSPVIGAVTGLLGLSQPSPGFGTFSVRPRLGGLRAIGSGYPCRSLTWLRTAEQTVPLLLAQFFVRVAFMNYFIVHAHHERRSFNGALTQAAQRVLADHGHEVEVSDLYAMGFDPVSDRRNFATTFDAGYLKQQAEEKHATLESGFAADIAAELEKLDWCDVLILQFPLWWFGLPAILKGWGDRVFAMERIYGGGRWFDDGYFAGKRALLSTTTGGGPGPMSAQGLTGDLHQHLHPINYGILRFVGFDVMPPFIAWGVSRASDERRQENIEQYADRLLKIPTDEPMSYRALCDYDPSTLRLRDDS